MERSKLSSVVYLIEFLVECLRKSSIEWSMYGPTDRIFGEEINGMFDGIVDGVLYAVL